jgi:hypothetical protein
MLFPWIASFMVMKLIRGNSGENSFLAMILTILALLNIHPEIFFLNWIREKSLLTTTVPCFEKIEQPACLNNKFR